MREGIVVDSAAMKRIGLRLALTFLALLMLGDFVFRGIVTARETTRNDFSEPYVGAWMWRHGKNFYDSALTRTTATQLTGSQVNLVLIYPPTALVLLAPFSYLPWIWANTIWLTLGLVGIAVTIFLLFRLGGFQVGDDRAWILATFVLAFSPLHQAFHMGNVALLAVPVCLLGVALAEGKQDFAAGIVLGIATALKPQLGLWPLLFYFLQFRRRIILGAMVPAVGLPVAFVDYPVPLRTLLAGYRSNLHYWFDPGHMLGFTEGAIPFHVNVSQVIIYQFVHSVPITTAVAYGIFVCGLGVWMFATFRTGFQIPATLAISSLSALSFVSLYHSVSDVTVLTLALCWVLQEDGHEMNRSKVLACAIFLMMMLPGHSALIRVTPNLGTAVTESWAWKVFVARYFVWLLLALNAVLLRGVVLASWQRSHSDTMSCPSLRS
jgi:hypothetical protein